jgi:hypothetical protein
MYGKRYVLPINFEVITDHMPISGALLDETLTFEMKVNDKKYVLNYLNAETANFEMKNICLEFETIRDTILYKEIERDLTHGASFLFDHVHHYRREEIKKSDAFINLEITGVDRRSLKGILLLFEDQFVAGERDSEMFMNPTIKTAKYTIDGLPNKHYSDEGYREWFQWREISKHFIHEEYKSSQDIYMDLVLYYAGYKFALWTDMRSTQDNDVRGTGKEHRSKDTIKMEIYKNVHANDNGISKYIMHVYVVADARINIKDKRLHSFDLAPL